MAHQTGGGIRDVKTQFRRLAVVDIRDNSINQRSRRVTRRRVLLPRSTRSLRIVRRTYRRTLNHLLAAHRRRRRQHLRHHTFLLLRRRSKQPRTHTHTDSCNNACALAAYWKTKPALYTALRRDSGSGRVVKMRYVFTATFGGAALSWNRSRSIHAGSVQSAGASLATDTHAGDGDTCAKHTI